LSKDGGHFNAQEPLSPYRASGPILQNRPYPDLSEVQGQIAAKRALLVAAAETHNLLFSAPQDAPCQPYHSASGAALLGGGCRLSNRCEIFEINATEIRHWICRLMNGNSSKIVEARYFLLIVQADFAALA
jgi:predicted ATPase with chaperone activity